MRTLRTIALASCYFNSSLLAVIGGLAARVTLVGTGGSKLAQLVTNHVLGNVYRNVLAAVVYCDSMTDELREDRGSAGPVLRTFFSPFSFISNDS